MSLGSFILGLFILVGGLAILRYYQPLADSFSGGIASYDRYKLAGLIVCITGVIIMFGIHVYILQFIVSFFPHL
jgi:uncharacterized membrane protein